MTKEELKNNIIELKESCRKLAEEYREKYNHDNSDKIALNMFYHNVISYNDYESVLALIENRNSVIMVFSAPPILTEETIEVNLKRITELEKENAELKKEVEKHKWNDIFLEESAFYDKKIAEEYTTLQERIAELEKENAELKGKLKTAYRKGMRHMAKALKDYNRTDGAWTDYFEHTVDKVLQREQLDFEEYGTLAEQLTKAKEIIKMLHSDCYSIAECEDTNLGLWEDDLAKAEQFLNNEVEK